MTVSVAERPIERTIAGMILRHSLVRVEFTVTETVINARAIPKAYHPQVAVNRQGALTKAAELSGGSISLQEAQRITEETATAPIATAYGDTFQEVVKALSRELKALK